MTDREYIKWYADQHLRMLEEMDDSPGVKARYLRHQHMHDIADTLPEDQETDLR